MQIQKVHLQVGWLNRTVKFQSCFPAFGIAIPWILNRDWNGEAKTHESRLLFDKTGDQQTGAAYRDSSKQISCSTNAQNGVGS